MTYETITKTPLDLYLDSTERAFLNGVLKKYNESPEWSSFGAWWITEYRRARISDGSVLYRVCQDLEARLGIQQGMVAPPDIRDILADRIDLQYGSRYSFCKASGVDPGHLSRFFAGKAGFSQPTLEHILKALHSKVTIQSDAEFEEQISPQHAVAELQEVTG